MYAHRDMRLGFATDIHIDHLVDDKGYARQRGCGRYIAEGLDALIIGGDISTGVHFKDHFTAFCKGAGIPVYFVLGNHDFWDAPDAVVRVTAASFPGYLDQAGVVELAPAVGLVGRSGWYDTLTGNPFDSPIKVNDWHRVERLIPAWRIPQLLQQECRQWASEEAEKARIDLEKAAAAYPRVFFVTHFPCFTKACWDEHGRPDVEENGWWPWSIDTTLGHVLLEVTAKHPQVDFTLLTGHTHGGGRTQLTTNLTCISGKARDGVPQLALSWQL